MSHILLIASGLVHPPIRGIFNLKRFLGELRYIKLTHETKLTEASASLLAAYDVVILYFDRPAQKLSKKTEKALLKYVNRGGGLLAVHSAAGSFTSSDAYFDLLGGRLLECRAVDRLSVIPHQGADRVFSDFPSFTIKDELCIHEFRDDVRVQMSVNHESGEIPVVWTRKQGEGRVCCISPGHCSATLKSFEVKRLLSSALNHLIQKENTRI